MHIDACLWSAVAHKGIGLLRGHAPVLDEVAQHECGASSPASLTVHIGGPPLPRIVCAKLRMSDVLVRLTAMMLVGKSL